MRPIMLQLSFFLRYSRHDGLERFVSAVMHVNVPLNASTHHPYIMSRQLDEMKYTQTNVSPLFFGALDILAPGTSHDREGQR